MNTFRFLSVIVVFLASLMAVPSHVAAQDAARPAPTAAESVPRNKAAKVGQYYNILFAPTLTKLIDDATKRKGSDDERPFADMCPDAQAYMDDFMGVQLKRYFHEDIVDKQLKPAMLQMLQKGLGEPELDAFLAFAATPDGQDYLRRFRDSQGAEDDLKRYAAYKTTPALRSYVQQTKRMDDKGLIKHIEKAFDFENNSGLKSFMDGFQAQLMSKVQVCQEAMQRQGEGKKK